MRSVGSAPNGMAQRKRGARATIHPRVPEKMHDLQIFEILFARCVGDR